MQLKAAWLTGMGFMLALALASVLALSPQAVTAQEEISVRVTISPERATVGDHLTLTIIATHAAGLALEGPGSPGDFSPLELVEIQPPETVDVGLGEAETRFVYTVAAFRTGELTPPPFMVKTQAIGGAAVTAQPPTVVIESLLPAEGDAGLRDLGDPLVASAGAPTWVWAALLSFGFVALTAITMAMARLPVFGRPPPLAAPPAPPEGEARRELDAIATAGLLARGELEPYYARIAACLRSYLSHRFDVPVAAMTPTELEHRLEEAAVDRWPARLAVNLLQQCEDVRFAHYRPARERAEADLSAAHELVTLTTQEESSPSGRPEAARTT